MKGCNLHVSHSREYQNTTSMIIAPCFDVGVSQQEDCQDDGDDVPARKDEPDRFTEQVS